MNWYKGLHVAVVAGALQMLTFQSAIANVNTGNIAPPDQNNGAVPGALMDAFDVARHTIRGGVGSEAYWTQTPAHGLHSTFSKDGFRLAVKTSESDAHRYQSKISLVSVGYGSAPQLIDEGRISVDGNRVEIDYGQIKEWFVNRPYGLEQGFTLEDRPIGYGSGENLQLILNVEGNLVPNASADGKSVIFSDKRGESVLQYAGLKAWDATGEPVTATMETQNQQILFQVADVGVQYPLTIDPVYTQQAYLKASNTGFSDYAGHAVSIDGNTAVVGAIYEDSNATGVDGDGTDNSLSNSGAAYVFFRAGGSWTHEAYLKASNPGANDQFGESVSVDGDTIVVGTRYEDSSATGVDGDGTDNSATDSGAAYVFVRSGGSWSPEAYLKAVNTDAQDHFGITVSVSGDTVVVGAPWEDGISPFDPSLNFSSASGAAYVFTRNAGVWSSQQYVKASTIGPSDYFGYSVDIDGDTIVIGAPFEDSNSTGVGGDQTNNSLGSSGAAYVLTRTAGVWSHQAFIKASNTDASDYFGERVAIDSDTIIVGARYEDSNGLGANSDQSDNSATSSGAAYIFYRDSGNWSQQAYLKASNTDANDQFGYSVGVSGDKAVVGAYFEDSSSTGIDGDQSTNDASNSGAAYVYKRNSGNWTFHHYLKASNTQSGDQFGWAVAVSGDSVLVGAYGEDGSSSGVNGDDTLNNFSSAGAAYVVYMPAPASPYAVCGNITGANHTFEFDNNGMTSTERYLHIGSSVGANDIYASFSLTGPAANATTHQVNNLPTDGRIIHLTLYSIVGGVEISDQSVCYTANADSPEIYAPVPGSVITGNSQSSYTSSTIKWNSAGSQISNYWLYLGSSLGGRQIHNSGDLGTATSEMVIDIPADGKTVYARLWYSTDDGTNWNYNDVTYRSRNNINGPYLTDPAPGASLGDQAYVVWVDDGPNDPTDKYRVYAGPNYGSSTWTFTSNLPYDQRSYQIDGWSATDYGKTVWVRFLWRKTGVWKRSNHSYVAGFGPAAIAGEETRPVPPGQ